MEVRGEDDEGFGGSWYTASVIAKKKKDKATELRVRYEQLHVLIQLTITTHPRTLTPSHHTTPPAQVRLRPVWPHWTPPSHPHTLTPPHPSCAGTASPSPPSPPCYHHFTFLFSWQEENGQLCEEALKPDRLRPSPPRRPDGFAQELAVGIELDVYYGDGWWSAELIGFEEQLFVVKSTTSDVRWSRLTHASALCSLHCTHCWVRT